MANFGIDLFEQDGDLVLGANGDLLCTDDVEIILNQDPETAVQFDGYVCLRESVANVISPSFGEYSHDEQTTGAGANATISKTNFEEEFNNFIERAKTQLLKDERIEQVTSITYNVLNNNTVNILMKLKVSGLDNPIPFVFPYSI